MSLSVLFFVLVAAVSLAAAVGVVVSRQPVHSALFLLTNFAMLAVLYVTLAAQFLAAVQVIVYAGGIVVLILFVIMLIGGDTNDFVAPQRSWTRVTALGLGILLLAGLLYSFAQRLQPLPPNAEEMVQGGVPQAVGTALFTKFILPFEVVAFLLLVALIGALILGRHPTSDDPEAALLQQDSTGR